MANLLSRLFGGGNKQTEPIVFGRDKPLNHRQLILQLGCIDKDTRYLIYLDYVPDNAQQSQLLASSIAYSFVYPMELNTQDKTLSLGIKTFSAQSEMFVVI